jgi:hypothetical protein
MKHASVCICLLLAASLHAQERFNNETILKLVKAGIGEETIVVMVNQQPGKYAVSADDLIALKKAGVSDKVIATMVVRNGASSVEPAPNVAARVKGSSETGPAPAIPRDASSTVGSSVMDGRTRVFVTDSQWWEMRGGWSAAPDNSNSGGGDYQSSGARPQTAEVIKTFNQRCPRITVTNSVERADFAVTYDHESGIGILHRHKIVVFNRDGDDIFSDSTRELGNSVKDACEAILRHRSLHGHPNAAAASAPSAANIFTPASLFDVTFTSAPPNAVVTISGQPIGRTPFTTRIPPGLYKAVFSIDGYATMSKDVAVGAGYPTTVSTTLARR